MQGKPKVTISNFTGMGDNGSFWMDGFGIEKYGSNGVLVPGLSSTVLVSNATTGYSTLAEISDFTKFISSSDITTSTVAMTGGSVTPRIYLINQFGHTSNGLVYTAQKSQTTYFPGIITNKSGNLFFANSQYVGIGYYGTATGGSTTTLVDSTKDFDALGFGSTTGRNKIFNITKNEARTISSALNETLTFSAGTAYASGDKYIAFYEDKFAFTATAHFAGQPTQDLFRRQILNFNDAYYILNGNYLAKISGDETTFDEYHKQLPSRVQAWCAAYNQDKMVVGCEHQGKGKLLLWDGYASGWQSVQETPSPINSIIAYDTGFIFLMGNAIYFTDGYSYKKVSKIPGAGRSYVNSGIFSSLCFDGENLYVGGIGYDGGRLESGLYVFHFETGWKFIPTATSAGVYSYKSSTPAIYFTSETINQTSSYNNVLYFSINASNYTINNIYSEYGTKRSVKLYIELPSKMNISQVELNLSGEITPRQSTSNTSNFVVNYSECKRDFKSSCQTNDTRTTTSFKNGQYANNCSVGDMLFFTGPSVSGQRAWITDIANAGTSNEVIAYSPATTVASDNNAIAYVYNLKPAGSKAIDDNNIPNEITYTIPSFYSDKMILEIYIDGDSNAEIHSINLY